MRPWFAILCWGAIIKPKTEDNKVSVVRFWWNQEFEERPTVDALRHLKVCKRCRRANEITVYEVNGMLEKLGVNE
jgi:hypothetical protein